MKAVWITLCQWDLLRKDLPSNINVLLRLWVIFEQVKITTKGECCGAYGKHKGILLACVKAKTAGDEVKQVVDIAVETRPDH